MSFAAISKPFGQGDCAELASLFEDMAWLEKPDYSRSDVKRAGNVLAGHIPCPRDEAEKAEITRWFKIAHNWRASHIVPMQRVRLELAHKTRKIGAIAVARLKRMQSIRKKLPSRSLHQIQDIAGCRAICPSMESLRQMLSRYRAGDTKHELEQHEDDYITVPKLDGYRSHHLKLKFRGSEHTEAYDGLRVELQLRTRLQHAWATAVEAVGLYRNEDLKGGCGDSGWLRFFELMASEAAASENAPLVPTANADQANRREEIRHLNEQLGALKTLEGFRSAIHQTDSFGATSARHYLVAFDYPTTTVSVRPYHAISAGSRDYDANDLAAIPENAVLVEVDKIADLKDAYPNYFLDVALFSSGVKRVLRGRDLRVSEPSQAAISPMVASVVEWMQSRS